MTSSVKYIALIRKEDDTDYWVDIPDMPGCISSGETIDDAMANFEEALPFHLKGIRKIHGHLPPPRDKEDVFAAEEDPWHQAYWVEVSNDDELMTSFRRMTEY